MNVDLPDTRSSAILSALTRARHHSGTAAVGMVLTLVVDVGETDHHDALRAAMGAAREHPCRIVTVIRRTASAPARLDAEIHVGDDGSLAQVVVLRLYGELRKQADSIVLPLLLPDAPVLVWWPGQAPAAPSQDALGLLAQRRVTDAAANTKPAAALKARRGDYAPGDTDLAWSRLTPWRTLLAAALDQPFDPITGGEVGAVRNNPSAELLATWLENRLGVAIDRKSTRGPGITSVRLLTKRGEIAITRPDGRLATLVRSGQPDRAVALPRRDTPELLAEEVRRLDPDEVYGETIRSVFDGAARAGGRRASSRGRSSAAPDTTGASARPRESTTARALEAKPLMPAAKGAPASVSAPAPAGKKSARKKPAGRQPATKNSATKKSATKGSASRGSASASTRATPTRTTRSRPTTR